MPRLNATSGILSARGGVRRSGKNHIRQGTAYRGWGLSPVAYYLAAAGVGTIGLIDDDVVSISNLQRQILHTTNDIDRPKVISAGEKLVSMNPECRVVTYQERLTASNVKDIFNDYDVVVDCTDNFETRFLANDACVMTKKPFFHGAVLRFFGQAMTIIPGQGPCYRCVFQTPPPPAKVQTCAQAGIINSAGNHRRDPGYRGLKVFPGDGRPVDRQNAPACPLVEFNKTGSGKIQTVLPAVATRQFDGVGRHKTAGRNPFREPLNCNKDA